MTRRDKILISGGMLALALIVVIALSVGYRTPTLERVEITPEPQTAVVGETIDLNARALSDRGEEMGEVALQWRVEGPGGAIDDTGRFTATQPGEVTVHASANGVTGSKTIQVQPRSVASIEAIPEAAGALPGTTLTLRVKARGPGEQPAGFNDITVSASTEGTSVSRDRITLDETGEAEVQVTLAPEAGENVLVLRSGGVTEEVRLQSTRVARLRIDPGQDRFEAGQTVDFEAVAVDTLGREASTGITWSLTGNSAQLQEDGKVLMARPGSGVIVAQIDGVRQGHPFTIVPGAVARIEIRPERAELKAGETRNFTVQAFNAHGYPVAADVDWTVEGAVGSVAPDGRFLATTVGTGAVRALRGDLSAQADVAVEHGALATMMIHTGDREELTAGETVNLSATGLDAFGNRFAITPERWYLSAPLGTIDEEKAAFTALYSGTGEIRAKLGNVLKGAPIEVEPAELAELRMEPLKADMIAGEAVQFSVTGFDRFGNRIDVTPQFSTRDPLGNIAASGTFTAQRAGDTIVEARVGEFSTQSSIAVKPAEIAQVSIIPGEPIDLIAGRVQDFDVAAVDAFGNAVESRITWRVRPDVGSISDEGILTPMKAGKGEVVAAVTQPRTGKTLTARLPVSVAPGETTRIALEPAALSAVAGEPTRFSATTYDQFGNETDVDVEWSLKDPALGTIQSTGLFMPLKAQSGEVVARHGNVLASAEVRIHPAELAVVKILPDAIALAGGERTRLNATVEDEFGNPVDATVHWSLSDDSLGLIAPNDELIAQKAGEGSLIAAAGSIADTAALEVRAGPLASFDVAPVERPVAAGSDMRFQVVALDAAGNRVDVAPQWTLEGNVGTIDDQGVFTAQVTGTGTVVASLDDRRAATQVEVIPGAPATIELTPQEIAATAGERVPIAFNVYDAHGNLIPNPSPQWTVENDLGRISGEGVFLARKAGEGAIVLRAGDTTAQIPSRVTPGEIHAIRVEPDAVQLTAGERIAFSARGVDAYGNPVELTPNWAVGPGLGTIDEQGVFHATTMGQGLVAVQSRDVIGVSAVTVEPGPVARVEVEPDLAEVEAGSAVEFVARAYDQFGNITDADVAWSFGADADLGTITETGAVRARQAGEGEVIASASDVTATARMRVAPGEVASLSLDPQRLRLTAGDEANISFVAKDRFGNIVPTTPEFTIRPERLGMVTEEGVFKAGQSGQGRLVASVQGVEASVPVEVRKGDLDSLVIELPQATLEAGKSYDLSAMGYDEGCNTIPVDAQWAVTEDIGHIDRDSGVFHARRAGEGMLVAYSGGIVAERPVKVTPGELHSLFIEPNPATVKSGTTHEFKVYGYDEQGNRVGVSVAAADWGTMGDIGTFERPGTFLGTVQGQGKVVARVNGREAESYVNVIPGVPDPKNSKIYVTHPTLAAQSDVSSEVLVEVRDAYNNPVPGIQVTLVSDRQADIIHQPPATDSEGTARGRIASGRAGTSTLHAVAGNRKFIDTEKLEFG